MQNTILSPSKYTINSVSKQISFLFPDFCPAQLISILNTRTGQFIYAPAMGILWSFTGSILQLDVWVQLIDTDILQVSYLYGVNYHRTFVNSFWRKINNWVDPEDFTLVCKWAWQTINQTGGNLVITWGTTANEETTIRTKIPFTRENIARLIHFASAAVVNSRLKFELVDIIWDNLDINVSSATACAVIIPNTNPYYAKFKSILDVSANGMEGMYISIGNLRWSQIWWSDVVGSIPGRYVIASASQDASQIILNFTVAWWTWSQSGKCTLYWWNFIEIYADSATATAWVADNGRNWYGSNLWFAAVTVPTRGTIADWTIVRKNYQTLFRSSPLTSNVWQTLMGTRYSAMPDEETPLYLQVTVRNWAVAPTAVTYTIWGINCKESNPIHIQHTSEWASSVLDSIGAYITWWIINTLTTCSAVTNITWYTYWSTSLPATHHHLISANTINATVVKASAWNFAWGSVCNNHATNPAYLKLYNKATAPVPASDTPIATIMIPPMRTILLNEVVMGFRFSAGLSYVLVWGMAVTDATAVAVAQCAVHIVYV